MPDRTRKGLRKGAAGLAIALLAFEARSPAAELWLHPLLPQAVAKAAPPPARRGARPVRPAPSAPAHPFPVALAGESSVVELTKGDLYPEPGLPIPPERIDRSYVRLGGGRPMPLTSAKADGAVTRLEATWAGQGLATLGVLLNPEAVTIEAAEFEAFLRETGATAALAERTRKKETKKAARAVAVESARGFAGISEARRTASYVDPAKGSDEPLGLPLEILAGAPPLLPRAGASFPVTILLDGAPAPGAVVRAYAPGGAPALVTADGEGRAVLPLEREGRLLLATASVRRTGKADRARGEVWKKADWEVRRTTLELLVLPAAPAPATTPAPKGKKPAPKKKPA